MITLNPKDLFLSDRNRASYKLLTDLATNPAFQEALTFALAQYRTYAATDPLASAKAQGAVEFCNELLNLPDKSVVTKPAPQLRPNLYRENATPDSSPTSPSAF